MAKLFVRAERFGFVASAPTKRAAEEAVDRRIRDALAGSYDPIVVRGTRGVVGIAWRSPDGWHAQLSDRVLGVLGIRRGATLVSYFNLDRERVLSEVAQYVARAEARDTSYVGAYDADWLADVSTAAHVAFAEWCRNSEPTTARAVEVDHA